MGTESKFNFIIVTGLSGAGKSQAVKCLEDEGYYCVDNLPPVFIPGLIDLCLKSGFNKLAAALDVRSRTFFDDFKPAMAEIKKRGINPYILFLDASDDVLIRRYAESRRQHPMAPNDRVANGIELERRCMQELKSTANEVIDTSNLSSHRLRGRIFEGLRLEEDRFSRIHITSFGFKHGIPLDTDLLFDCRFLPNPYYIPSLKPLSGLDKDVCDYLHTFDNFDIFTQKILDLLTFLRPLYLKEGKLQVNVAFGCTGGRHRSVALAEAAAQALSKAGYKTSVEHRDIDKSGRKSGEN